RGVQAQARGETHAASRRRHAVADRAAAVNFIRYLGVVIRSAWAATFLLFPLPSSWPKRNSVRPGPTFEERAHALAPPASAALTREGRARRAWARSRRRPRRPGPSPAPGGTRRARSRPRRGG